MTLDVLVMLGTTLLVAAVALDRTLRPQPPRRAPRPLPVRAQTRR